jgi:hypothetical protein
VGNASGFTFEAFVKIPLDWNSSDNSWRAVLMIANNTRLVRSNLYA